jgi:hypothetical protein
LASFVIGGRITYTGLEEEENASVFSSSELASADPAKL